jgi:hypothetical protein
MRMSARSNSKKAKSEERRVRKALQRELKVKLPEKEVSLTGACKPYAFDMVSPDGTIVGETKTYAWRRKRKPDTATARASDACLFLLHAKDAKKRLLVLTDRKFYEYYVRSRQGQMVQADGVTIRTI